MDEVQRLRFQSAKARRLADSVSDPISKDALFRYAEECESSAAHLETDLATRRAERNR